MNRQDNDLRMNDPVTVTLTYDEILDCAAWALKFGRNTIVDKIRDAVRNVPTTAFHVGMAVSYMGGRKTITYIDESLIKFDDGTETRLRS